MRVFLITICSIFISLTSSATKAQTSKGAIYTPDGEQIVFFSSMEGNGELWVMDQNGDNLHKITKGDNHDRWVQFSSDGNTLIFVSPKDGDWEVYTINIDGSNRQQITNNDVMDLGGTFSPDGKHIAVSTIRDDETGMGDLFIMDRDGKNRQKVAENAYWPSWANDNKNILYGHKGELEGTFNIWSFNTETKVNIALTNTQSMNFGGNLSPDGTKILFTSNRDGAFSIYEMNRDGSNQKSLNIPVLFDGRPTYSPDGKNFLFADKVISGTDIFRYEFETKKIENITPN